MSLHVWLIYVSASTILFAIPGPTSWIIMRCAADRSPRRLAAIVAGAVLGDATAMMLCNLGLGAILATSASALTVVKFAAAAYLVALGLWGLFHQSPTAEVDVPTTRRVFAPVYLVTALNPKGIAFLCAFLPQFIDSTRPVTTQLLILQITFCVLSLVSASLWSLIGAYLRAIFARSRIGRWSRRGTSMLFIGAGVAEAVAKVG